MPLIGRVTFVVHLVVALVLGLGLLLAPDALGLQLGFSTATPTPLELDPILRAFGAMILGLGGLTSLYGLMTKRWERVDYVVRGEITYLALATAVFLVSALLGRGASQGNWILTAVAAVLLTLFVLTWVSRPQA